MAIIHTPKIDQLRIDIVAAASDLLSAIDRHCESEPACLEHLRRKMVELRREVEAYRAAGGEG